jgi:hypothetical protein
MRKRYVAFYWTRWVPPQYVKQGTGFTSLSENPNEAARQSRTIRYQRELIKRFVTDEKGELADEVVYLEKHLDRGSEAIVPPLQKAGHLCHAKKASLLYVEFWSETHWRKHNYLLRTLKEIGRGGIEVVPVVACPIHIEGEPGDFDPIEHFQTWDEEIEYSRRRRDTAENALREMASKYPGRGRYKLIAAELNDKRVPTLSGRTEWTDEIVRQLIKYRLPELDENSGSGK